MSSITCCTCKVKFSNDDITKHLTSTRHKTVEYGKSNEIIACESCEDTNIHQLQILRFGLNDMSLLCQMCLGKEDDTPDAQYSLNNGSFFKKIDQFYKFRDIKCQVCSNDKKLFVGNGSGRQHIVCRNCFQGYQGQYPSIMFAGEDSDTFLSELLGLTEFIPKKGGKKTGRGTEKRGRKVKKLTPKMEKEAQERRDHYFNKINQTKEIKSGSIVKAVGVEEVTKSVKDMKIGRGQNTGGFGKNGGFGKSGGNGKTGGSLGKSGGNGKPGANGKTFKGSKPSLGGSGGSGGSGPSPGFNSRTGSTPGSHTGSKTGSNYSSKKNSNSNSVNVSRSSTPVSFKGKGEAGSHVKGDRKDVSENVESRRSEKLPKGDKKGDKKDKKVNGEKKDTKGGKTEKAGEKPSGKGEKSTGKGEKSIGKGDKSVGKGDKPAKKEKSAKTAKVVNGVSTPVSPFEQSLIPPTPPPVPPTQYDSLPSYFNQMSHNLFLEEQYGVSSGENKYLEPTEFSLGWFQEQDKKHKQFFVEIDVTEEFKKKHLQARLVKFRRSPFAEDQAVFLVYNDSYPWFGKIILNETVAVKRGSKKEKLELVIQLYSWDTQKLPLEVNIKKLKLLPASVPISRVFYAMDRIENPKFQKMLLGHEPIQQLVFRNFVKLSEGKMFNESQKVALQSVLNNSITVLQGPPGTGKTSTIHEIILQLLNNFNTYPILVVAASNIAIDNIAEKMLETHEKSIIRIVSNSKEVDYNDSHKLGKICLHNKMYGMLPEAMKETIKTLRSPRADTVSMNQHKKLRMKQYELSNTLVGQARVIFTTSVVAGGGYLKGIDQFPVVIMDEATQSSEPITLIPLSMPGVKKFVFVGDQKQLSSFTQVPNLSLSLFERVLLNGTYKTPHMLDTQYRMHPHISEFPRNRFYSGQLKDGITPEQRSKYPIKKAVEFWDTKGTSPESRVRAFSREDHGFTYDNKGEIKYIIQVLMNLIIEKNIDRKDIAIITPYRGQRDLISKQLSQNDIINPNKGEILVESDRDDIDGDTKPVTIHTVSDIMIASIDAFQGREKDLIIFSCVRSNTENKIGFLNDERRLNVALTRARHGLVLIGDYKCLVHDTLWKQYLDHLTNNGFVNTTDKFDM